MLFDTHVHFDMLGPPDQLGLLVARAGEAGVERMIAVGSSGEANTRAVEVAAAFPGRVIAAMGFDRDEAEAAVSDGLESRTRGLEAGIKAAELRGVRVAAIGEIGLDFHYSPGTREAQQKLFKAQLDLAGSLRLPVIVHSREAEDVTAAMLAGHAGSWTGAGDRIGVLHCFTGTAEFAREIVALGFNLSFSGIITFGNAGRLRAVAGSVPENSLLIETDSPYLAPAPWRGKRNEPAHLPSVAKALGEARGVSAEEAGALTARNAIRLFG